MDFIRSCPLTGLSGGCFWLCIWGLLAPLCGQWWGYEGARHTWDGMVWETSLPADQDTAAYQNAVARLLQAFEQETGRSLSPGTAGRVGLKVYTQSGLGLATPPDLTAAVIQQLVARGYQRSDLFIIDARERYLREAGYLPPLSQRAETGDYFQGVPVRYLDDGQWFDDLWVYDSPLPREFTHALSAELLQGNQDEADLRISHLAAPLITEVDFWINLPMATSEYATGVSGALVNGTLWNINNRDRFFASPANAPVAIAEIAAIPELLANWAINIMPLTTYQYIGGPRFHALYTETAPRLWLSVDPVVLDALVADLMTAARLREGFPRLSPRLPLLRYAEELGVGEGDARAARIRKVTP